MYVAVLWLICLPVDWSGGHSTPAGLRGRGRPRRRQSAEEAPGPSPRKASARSGNQQAL
jgi:hypothetical protein